MTEKTPTPRAGGAAASNADTTQAWLADLRAALQSDRRVRARRIVAEAEDHLQEAVADLEAEGMSPEDAARAAVTRLGSPDAYAAQFRSPTGSDWVVDVVRTGVPVLGWLLVAVGAIATVGATIDWMLGHHMRGHGVRVWRTCTQSVDGQCVGWREHYASSSLIGGGILIVVGLLLVLVAFLIRRRYSQREVFPRWAFWVGDGLLAALGAYLIIGGAIRSSIDQSWSWVPFWAVPGVICLLVAALAARHERRALR